MVSDLRDRDNDNNDDGTENYDVVHWSIQKKNDLGPVSSRKRRRVRHNFTGQDSTSDVIGFNIFRLVSLFRHFCLFDRLHLFYENWLLPLCLPHFSQEFLKCCIYSIRWFQI